MRMEDKEVGELWIKYLSWGGLHGMQLQTAKNIISLIRKLVDERALRLVLQYNNQSLWTDAEMDGARRIVLKDFGIDSETFTREVVK